MRYGEDQLGHTAKEPGCTCDKWPMLPEKMYDDQIILPRREVAWFLTKHQKINASCTMYIKVGWLECQPFDKEGTLSLNFPLQPTCEGLSSSLERLIGEVARILRQKLSLMQTQAELIQSLSHRYFRSVGVSGQKDFTYFLKGLTKSFPSDHKGPLYLIHLIYRIHPCHLIHLWPRHSIHLFWGIYLSHLIRLHQLFHHIHLIYLVTRSLGAPPSPNFS